MDNKEIINEIRNGNNLVRNKLITGNLLLAYSRAKKFKSRVHTDPAYDMDDLNQVAMLGLVESVKDFDPIKYPDVMFSTYSVFRIDGRLRRFIRDEVGRVKYPRTMADAKAKIYYASRKLELLNIEITGVSIKNILDDIPSEIIEMVLKERSFVDIDSSISYSKSGDSMPISSIIGEEDPSYNEIEILSDIQTCFSNLSPSEISIVRFVKYEGKSQSEVGKILGISQVQVSRLLTKAINKIKNQLGNDYFS